MDQNSSETTCVICSKPSTLKCSNCAINVFYCSKECQKSDWKKHKIDCVPITISFHPDYGTKKVMISTRVIKAGEVFLREKPFMTGPRVHRSFEIQNTEPADLSKFPVCLGCYRVVRKKNSKCSKCNWPVCGEACEKEYFHAKFECNIFKEHHIPPLKFDKVANYASICIMRLILLKEVDKKKWDLFTQLDQRWAEHGDLRSLFGVDMMNHQDLMTAFFKRCRFEVEPKLLDFVTRQYFTHRHGKKELPDNYDPNYRHGSYFFIKQNFVQKCCMANSYRLLIQGKSTENLLRACVELPKGTVITICPDYTSPTSIRQTLYQSFDVECKCLRCKDPTELGTFFSAVKCRACTDGFCVPLNPITDYNLQNEWICYNPSCQSRIFLVEIESQLRGMREDKEIDTQMFRNQIFSPGSIDEIISKYESKVVHPNHFYLLRMKVEFLDRTNFFATSINSQAIDDDVKRKMIKRAEEGLALMNTLFPGIDRNKGIFLYHLQKQKLHFFMRDFDNMLKCGDCNLLTKDMELKARLKTEFQEILKIRKQCADAYEIEPTTVPEYKIALECKSEPKVFKAIKAFLQIS